jgi:hypothetical protein
MPKISRLRLAALQKVADDAAALSASVQRDETGDMIGQQFVGNGNGGNLSLATIKLNAALQRGLAHLAQLEG